MAIALRAASAESNASFWRLSIGFLRNLSSSSTPNATASASANPNSDSSSAKKTKRRKKKKNLFEVAQFLPNWGIGYHMAKTHWTNVSYEITRINLYKDGRHGKAWGLAYKDGSPADAPKKISGVHKRCWKYIPNLKKTEVSTPKAEVQAA
ncbi:28S ribosomal protein [Actinidia chinensis var. chinensis]|uniref:28S ribosomal protein n=1 Tax=Actinidia chinensis var. chinensis TaxID=1590841 RepID=A0A2R6QJ56_ACTCC|nr:28S ribosomal protein [Actinidia chinensis var. chinensis]